MLVQNNKALYIKKEWQIMNPTPVITNSGDSHVIYDPSGKSNHVLITGTLTSSFQSYYLYNQDQDSYLTTPSLSLGGSAGIPGSCGTYHPWSIHYTANGGTTTSVTVSLASFNIEVVKNNSVIIEFISSGINSGLRRTIIDVTNRSGVITLTFDSAVPTTVLTSHTFRLSTGRFYDLGSNTTLGNGRFTFFDLATLTWNQTISTTGLPAWGLTDSKMTLAYQIDAIFSTGICTSGGGTTLTDSIKTWTTNQWTNYQVRITSGTGMGQTRTVSSNTSTVITISSSWTTNPDNTSVYSIEGNEDFIYLIGNNAITMYRYSISTDTWITVSPTVARSGIPGPGLSLDWIGVTGDSNWANESLILDGRLIYSFRGSGTSILDRYDIVNNTWASVNYSAATTFSIGTSYTIFKGIIYIKQGTSSTAFFKYNIPGNFMDGFPENKYSGTTMITGNRIWVKKFNNNIYWLYYLVSSDVTVERIMIY